MNSRFVEEEVPYWEQYPPNAKLPAFLFGEGTDHELEKMAIDFIQEPGNFVKGPMVQAKLFQGTAAHLLVVKLSHLCSDGAGVKKEIYQIAGSFSNSGGIFEVLSYFSIFRNRALF